jgi:DNA polymerase-1
MAASTKASYKKHTEQVARPVAYRDVLKWEAVTDINYMKQLFEGKKFFSFDTETTGLDYNRARLAGFSFCFDSVTGYYVPISHKTDINADRSLLDYVVSKICDNDIIVYMFNKRFDLNILEISEKYEIGVRMNVKDVQALIWLRDTDITMPSLKWASEHFLGIIQPRYDDVAGSSTFDYAKVEDITEYAALDAICTLRLVPDTLTKHKDLKQVFEIDDKSIEAMRIFEKERIRLDIEWLKKEHDSILFKIKETENKIYGMVGYEFNVNSDIKVAEALQKSGAILTEKTPGGRWCVSMDILEKLDIPLAKLLVENSRMGTYLSTFVKNLIGESDLEGKIRFNYKLVSVVTGRFSSGGDKESTYYAKLNAQNIPKPHQIEVAMVHDSSSSTGWDIRNISDVCILDESGKITGLVDGIEEAYICETGCKDGALRSAFLPDDEDSVWVSIDYSGQELRIAANFSHENTFIEAYRTGGDPHMTTAKAIWGPTADKNHRRMAKGANFALQYGGSAYTLMQNLNLSKVEADDFFKKYCAAMPTLIAWQAYMKKQAKQTGVVKSAFGRPYRLGKFFTDGVDNKMRSYGERCALNYPIQGTGGDVIRIAVVRVLNVFIAMKKAVIDGFTFKSTVHDEINYSVKKWFLHDFMRTIPVQMRMNFQGWAVPLEVETSIGNNWSECVPYTYNIETRVYTPKGKHIKK